ncbi:lantibiotic dehydratase [Nocardiopsis chromatogenes]|uniref:lantibiotic dehydratase n=1 Tax=Nocardiopsis chromatogenes TaxID=280239 RepID=UPI00034789CE|nr:lantibiotic dehydratase [Nocardiopsis chromatogenes]
MAVRMAGLPAVGLAELAFNDTAEHLRSLLSIRRRVGENAGELGSELYNAIAGLPDGSPAKPALVALRRSVYRLRRPSARVWNAEVATSLPGGLAKRVDSWIKERELWHEEQHAFAATLSTELHSIDDRYCRQLSDPWFRRGLFQADQVLSGVLDRWLADPRRRPRRRSVSRLVRYATRAAAKTSPFSGFMVAGSGQWVFDAAGAPADPPSAPRSCGARGVSELYEAAMRPWFDTLVERPDVKDTMTVRLNPSVTRGRDRLRFLGPPPTEQVVTIGTAPAIAACLRLVADNPPMTPVEVRDRLAAAAGSSGTRRAALLLDRLCDIGLLELLPPDGVRPTAPEALSRWVQDIPAIGDETRERLDILAHEIRNPVPVDDVMEHRRRQTRLAQVVARLTEDGPDDRASDQAEAEDAEDGRDASGAAHAVAADALVADRPLAFPDAAAWQPVLDDLRTLGRWLAALVPEWGFRRAMDSWWHRRFADLDSMPFVDFHYELMAEIEAGTADGQELGALWQALPAAVYDLSDDRSAAAEAAALNRSAMSCVQRPVDSDGVARVDMDELASFAAATPGWLAPLRSLGVYAQPVSAPGDRQVSVVLNRLDTGFGRGHSRMAYLRGDATAAVGGRADGAAEAYGPPPVPAAIATSQGIALNDRMPSVPYEIAYPFQPPPPPGVSGIALGDLAVRSSAGRDGLFLVAQGLDVEVTPVHLGMMGENMLPPAARLMLTAFGERPPDMPWNGRGLLRQAPVEQWPRLQAGRVVLSRAQWAVAGSQVPRRRKGESDAVFLLRLAEWRDGLGVPERCFVRPVSDSSQRRRSLRENLALRRTAKPLYVDFANVFLVDALEAMVGREWRTVIFEEALPDPSDWAERGSAHVTEYLVEVPLDAQDGAPAGGGGARRG